MHNAVEGGFKHFGLIRLTPLTVVANCEQFVPEIAKTQR